MMKEGPLRSNTAFGFYGLDAKNSYLADRLVNSLLLREDAVGQRSSLKSSRALLHRDQSVERCQDIIGKLFGTEIHQQETISYIMRRSRIFYQLLLSIVFLVATFTSCTKMRIEEMLLGKWRIIGTFEDESNSEIIANSDIQDTFNLEFQENGCFHSSLDTFQFLSCPKWEFFKVDSSVRISGITSSEDTIVRSVQIVRINREYLDIRSPKNFHSKAVSRFRKAN
jgi:hypothetical protein